MIYKTSRLIVRGRQVTWEDILDGRYEDKSLPSEGTGINGSCTVTKLISENNVYKYCNDEIIVGAMSKIEGFISKYEDLYTVSREELYNTFYIPKASGGLRRIDAPNDKLKAALYELKSILEDDFKVLYHTSAFAYVKTRCAVDSVKRHQGAQSKWFLKTDFENFFGNTTKQFVMRMMYNQLPFHYLSDNEREKLEKAMDLCFLNGGLPQGTPISPMLTNLVMIPIDHALFNSLTRQGLVYTRYADDILISSKVKWKWSETIAFINETLKRFNAKFRIKDEKTRFGSSAGSNWNLGVMLNKDNNITIGYRNKEQFRAMTFSYLMDRKNNIAWEKHDVEVMNGLFSYYFSIEPKYIVELIRKNEEKTNMSFKETVRKDLRTL